MKVLLGRKRLQILTTQFLPYLRSIVQLGKCNADRRTWHYHSQTDKLRPDDRVFVLKLTMKPAQGLDFTFLSKSRFYTGSIRIEL